MKKFFYFPLLKNSFFVLMLGIILLPFFWLSFFSVPSLDDYTTSAKTISIGYLDTQLSYYMNWNGRYVSTALQSIPLFLNFWIYRLIPVAFFLLFIYSFYLLFKIVYPFNHYSKFNRLLFSLSILALYLTNTVTTSNFYWLSATVTYILPLILLNYLLVYLYKIFIENNKKLINIALASFLIFLIIGTGEIGMISLDVFILFLFLFSFFKDKKLKVDWTLFFLGVVALISSLILILAPGNSARESATAGIQNVRDFVFAINASWDAILNKGYDWLFGEKPFWIIIFPTIFLVYRTFSKQQEQVLKKINIYFINPLLALFLWFILTMSSFFILYYSVGKHGPARAFAMIQLLFYFGFFYVLCTISFYIWKYYRNKLDNISFQKIAYILSYVFLAIAVGVMFFFGKNLKEGYTNMITEKSKNFYNVNEQVKNMISGGGNGEIFVPGKIKEPKFTSFGENKNFENMAIYFGKNVKVAHDLNINDYYIAKKYINASLDAQEIGVYLDDSSNSIIYKVNKNNNLDNKEFYIEITLDNEIMKKQLDWDYEQSEIDGYFYHVFYLPNGTINNITTYQSDKNDNKYWGKKRNLNIKE